MNNSKKKSLLLSILPLLAVPAISVPLVAQAQDVTSGPPALEEVIVTAQRREVEQQDVPISVTALSGERFNAMFEGGDDIRALANRIPDLYAESSNGRLAPRFYIRGLGNSDFDLAASQPVSVIFDDIVQENVILKSYPLFDIERVEVYRGPQGTLFGRNTPAGIVQFHTRKPTRELEGYLSLAYGTMSTINAQGAVGGPIGDTTSARLSMLFQDRQNWMDNRVPGAADPNSLSGSNKLGAFREFAYRVQFQGDPSDSFSWLLNLHGRHNDGTASIFRGNVLGPGSNGFNSNYDRDSVTWDDGDNNPQEADAFGGSFRFDYDFANDVTLTSITGYETVENSSLGDIDGGFGADFLPAVGPCPPGPPTPTCIPFPAVTQDGIDDLDQYTQEFRLSSQASAATFWQAGVFFFDSEFSVTTMPFFVPPTTVVHENTAWAVFGHVSHDLGDAWTLSGGVRYTDDDKDFTANAGFLTSPPVSVSDEQVSWDVNALWRMTDDFNLYGRVAEGFRAPTIQGRDVAFFGAPSVAQSETILSGELGFKSMFANNRVRLNGSVYTYTVDDMQLSAIGGALNTIMLVNADEGTGTGFDLDGEFLLTDNLLVTAGFSITDTEIDDPNLGVAPCGSGLCTVLDPLLDPMDPTAGVAVDGNSFVQAPDYTAIVTVDYRTPLGPVGEFFFFTDWAFQGETQFFLYESMEFFEDDTLEGGIRLGYANVENGWEVAIFGRNITDEENVKGAIDFNNLTGFDNEPQVWGISYRKDW